MMYAPGWRPPRAVTPLLISAMIVLLPFSSATGQTLVDRAMECFVGDHVVPPDPCETPPDTTAVRVMLEPDVFSASLVQSMMEGLEDLAQTHPDEGIRLYAAIWLGVAGQQSTAHSANAISRLEAIYDRADPIIRGAIVRGLHLQKARSRAIQFAEAAAKSRRSDEVGAAFPNPYLAVQSLLHMGEEGRDALRRLVRSGEVPNRRALARLRFLAEHDFRQPPHRRR